MRFNPLKKAILPVLVCLAVAGCWKSSEERAAEHFDRGMALMAEGDTQRAFVEFRNTLKYAKNDVEARRQIAQIHLQRGRKTQAYRNYLAVVEQNPEDLPGRTVLSELAFESGNWPEFERHAAEAVQLASADPDATKFAGRTSALDMALRFRRAVLDDDGPAQEAILVEAEGLQQDNPNNPITRKILINGYVSEGRYDDALVLIDQSIEAEPDLMDNYGARLEILSRQNDVAAVEAELRRMAGIFPEDVNVKTTLLRFLTSRGKIDEAEEFLRDVVAGSPEDEKSEAFSTLVAFLLRTKGADTALAEVETALQNDPSDSLRLMRASLQFDMGQRKVALEAMQALVGAEETSLDVSEVQQARVLLARMLAADGNEVGARKLVEEVLVEDPNAVEALKMKAAWQIEDDNTDGAITDLRTALDAAPQDAEIMQLMAQAYRRSGNADLMLDFLSLAVEATNSAPPESIRYAQALIEQDKDLQAESVLINSLRITPSNVDVLTMLGQVYIKIEDFGRARQVIDTLSNIDSTAAQNNANALNIDLVSREQGAESALEFLEGMAANEGNAGAKAQMALIRARIQSGDTEGALSFAKALVKDEPDNLRNRYALALTHASVGAFDDAEAEFRTILKREPKIVQAWLQLARVRTARGEEGGALETIEEGLQAVPGAPDLLWGKASLLQRNGDIDAAIDIFDELYATNSNSLIVANNLASLLATYRTDTESLDRARVISRRLSGTEVPAFQDTYGWIAHRTGDSEEAVTYLEPAAAALTRDASVQVHLGLVYAALGRREDAIAQLRKSLDVGGPLSGNDTLLEEARAKIEELETMPANEDASDQN